MTTWLLIPCTGSRAAELRDTIKLSGVAANRVVIVTTRPDTLRVADLEGLAATLLIFDRPGMLFGEWMNLGLGWIAALAGDDPYEVACLSSDVQGCDGFALASMRTELRERGLGMVGPDLHGRVAAGDVLVNYGGGRRDVFNRVPGPCFMVAGELGIRFDPQFRWWYSDCDFEAQHLAHGVGLIGGLGISHADNPPSEQSQAHAVVDRQRYVDKWGWQPW